MAEPAIALREHPQIIELFTVLEQNGLHQQKDEVQALVSYIDAWRISCPGWWMK